MNRGDGNNHLLAAEITKASSKQTYYTIRCLVDRELVDDAYRGYGYFRWVDDTLDAETGTQAEKDAFVKRQKLILDTCYVGMPLKDLSPEEHMLASLVANDTGGNPGLRSYLYNMMRVMTFDTERRGRVISQAELSHYTHALAVAVTEAMYYFIDHEDPGPQHEERYLAVTAAHITHMLRDAVEDIDPGYFNIPGEYIQTHHISPQDVTSEAYRKWTCQRVKLAREYFKAGRRSLAQVKNLRCRLAGYAYAARFELVLRIIERENFCLRCEYKERKNLKARLWVTWSTLTSFVKSLLTPKPQQLAVQPIGIEKL
jgi:phytoene/squalene synthetase